MNEIIFNSKINGRLVIKEVDRILAKKIIVENHYSNKWNSSFGTFNVGIFKEDDPDNCLGVAVFGNLMNPQSYKSIGNINKGEIIELNRMWIDDCLGKNSESILISKSFKLLKHKMPHVKFVQSFADGRLGCGTIYKATNFKYYGKSNTIFGQSKIDGEIIHKVRFENTGRWRKMIELCYRFINNEFDFFTVNTYRYIYALNYSDYKLITLKENKYPEYSIGSDKCEYVPTINNFIRVYMIYEKLGDVTKFTEVKQYITKKFPDIDFKSRENEISKNKFIVSIRN